MQIVRRETIGSWTAHVVERPAGHYLVVKAPDTPDVIKFLAANFAQSMRMVDRIVEKAEGRAA